MKKALLFFALCLFLLSCKEDPKTIFTEIKDDIEDVSTETKDSVLIETKKVIPKTIKQIKEELTSQGFKVFDYVDKKTKDTILMQQYFMAFLKKGPIRGQNEEEAAQLQKQHIAHLKKMYDMGFADISGPFGDESDMRGVTIYNVPTLKIADSLANSDPMVIAGRLEIEMHPWWATKGFTLR